MPASTLAQRRFTPTRSAEPLTTSRRPGRQSLALFVILTAQLMVVLDGTIVNVALPHIQRGLSFSGSGLSWVLNAYILTFGGLVAAWRTGWRPARAAPNFPYGHCRLHARVAGGRPRYGQLDVADGAGPSRSRGRFRCPFLIGPAHHIVP